jgi:16S rRNA A1518/A1519 N6-dimethyltransferase RsmA/KsgA/DIM1 with predicted DNA glycosylase/AP lyase activity
MSFELLDTPKHSDLIFDVGMHQGEDSEFYLKKGFRVVGIEADPDLAQACRVRLKQYLDRGQLVVVEGAVVGNDSRGGGERKVRFFKNDGKTVWGTT